MMFVIYDPSDNDQVQAVYSNDPASTAWAAFTKVEVTDQALAVDLLKYGRNCRVTIVAGEVTVVTQFAYPVALAVLKQLRHDEIDVRTVELIDQGFVHATKTFSLSRAAQSKWHGKYNARADVAFPFDVATIDNDAHTVADGAEAKTMYLLVVNTVNGHLESGGDLKKSIFDAVDKAAVDAIVDTR